MEIKNEEFWLKQGDRVQHKKDPGVEGTVVHIDGNLIEAYGVTTCLVRWDDCPTPAIQWTTSLFLSDKGNNK